MVYVFRSCCHDVSRDNNYKDSVFWKKTNFPCFSCVPWFKKPLRFQRENGYIALFPKALPWAIDFCPFRSLLIFHFSFFIFNSQLSILNSFATGHILFFRWCNRFERLHGFFNAALGRFLHANRTDGQAVLALFVAHAAIVVMRIYGPSVVGIWRANR